MDIRKTKTANERDESNGLQKIPTAVGLVRIASTSLAGKTACASRKSFFGGV